MPIERETIITDRGHSSGIIIGIIVALLVIIALGFMVEQGGFSFGGHETTIHIDIPKVTVTPVAK